MVRVHTCTVTLTFKKKLGKFIFILNTFTPKAAGFHSELGKTCHFSLYMCVCMYARECMYVVPYVYITDAVYYRCGREQRNVDGSALRTEEEAGEYFLLLRREWRRGNLTISCWLTLSNSHVYNFYVHMDCR